MIIMINMSLGKRQFTINVVTINVVIKSFLHLSATIIEFNVRSLYLSRGGLEIGKIRKTY